MTRVLLINQGHVPHYRVPVYGRLSKYLGENAFEFMVAAEGIQPGNPHSVEFSLVEGKLSVSSLVRVVRREKIAVIISWVDMKHLYLFPMYLIAKGLLGKKMIYWGQGRDLLDRDARIKNLAYAIEQVMCDAIILYAEHLKKYVRSRFHKKVFVANNTLCLSYQGLAPGRREGVLARYGIHTTKNIICVGRIQRRKRLENLVKAHAQMNRPDIGLILVGPDPEEILDEFQGGNIYKAGPLYGEQMFDLLSAADLYCLPGAVGLSIIDAFHCGLPFVTEEGDESAEIMYLKDGVNGFIVPRGDIQKMAEKLLLLLDNNTLRLAFSEAAKKEIAENGHIDKLCAGFTDALRYVIKMGRVAH